ncbi:sugar ABC transporter ATP-binding protein [Propionivibrio sp.]|uniref:sugar ABC transporter ATP-binding protein n=1 Tax=Propionivibrio sp. TaxID=2212460 RepID=UPI00272DE731|nr:sugar ABC transporter ATP-binding protein [Propionivibrio sp.]
MANEYVLETRGIRKVFPGVVALDGISLRFRPGSVHALMGENGAGKSTLMKILSGMYKPTEGIVLYKGVETEFNAPIESIRLGIAMIHQELSPVPHRSVMENVWLGREPLIKGTPFVDHRKMHDDTKRLLDDLELSIDPRIEMAKLTVAKMQMVEIAKAVSYNADVVIMDEPTSSLTKGEVEHLFRIIRRLREQGKAIIYISHKMDEIFAISDEVSVLRDGNYVGTYPAAELNTDKLIALMVGRELNEMFPKVECPITDVKLEVKNLSSPGAFQDVSFAVRKGEILGFAGLVGAGRTEVMETLFGIRHKSAGSVLIDDKPVDIRAPEDAIRHKMALLTEDRRLSGIFPMLDIKDNMIMAVIDRYRNRLGKFLNHAQIRNECGEYRHKIKIKTPSLEQKIMNLSGGNQQKVLVARWLMSEPEILILDEPTRGIDVGAKAEIHTLITNLAAKGKAIILVSSELPEILGMSDRIAVMREGRLTGIVERKDATQEVVMKYATMKP